MQHVYRRRILYYLILKDFTYTLKKQAKTDTFYSIENQSRLLIAKERMEKSGGTIHELIEVDEG